MSLLKLTLLEADSMFKFEDSDPADSRKYSPVGRDDALAVETEDSGWLGADILPPVPKESNWIGATAQSAMDTVVNNPLETGGTALLALLAIRFKTPILEEMAQAAAGLGKTVAKSGSGVPLIRASRPLAEEAATVADSTFVSPWAKAAAKLFS